MPEFLKPKITVTDSPVINYPIDTLWDTDADTTYMDNTTPNEVLQPTVTIDNDCKSYWLNRIIVLQKQHDLNELHSRYGKTFTRNQILTMLNNSNKYSEDVFHINEAHLCDRYEKLKIGWYYRLHASDAMIIDTSGNITFITLNKKNK